MYGHHFESAAMNGTRFQDPIGFIKFSISPECVPLLMDKDSVSYTHLRAHETGRNSGEMLNLINPIGS